MSATIKLLVWVGIVIAAVIGMQWLYSNYTLNEMREVIADYHWYVLSGYALLISVRGILFIPTMPIILMMASAVDSWLLFIVTLAASCCSAYLVCLAVDYLDMRKRLDALPGKTIKRAQRWVNSMGVAAVAGWAFFPLVFTEIIVYLARLSGLGRKQLVLAVALGEGLLIGMLVFVTDWIVGLVQY